MRLINQILGLLLTACCATHAVQAAESYDNCTGFIDTVPAVISTQGTWCMRHDIATAIGSGNAINVTTNNVTINCNDFKLGGLSAGLGTSAVGIGAVDRMNITVRSCNIRGFLAGVSIGGLGGGHVVQDNRLDGNTYVGVTVDGDGSTIERNRVVASGGGTTHEDAYGIHATGSIDVIDNVVYGVTASAASNGSAYGIFTLSNHDARVSNNRVRGLLKFGVGNEYAIYNQDSLYLTLRENDVVGNGTVGSIGLRCWFEGPAIAVGNSISGFNVPLYDCGNDGGNVTR